MNNGHSSVAQEDDSDDDSLKEKDDDKEKDKRLSAPGASPVTQEITERAESPRSPESRLSYRRGSQTFTQAPAKRHSRSLAKGEPPKNTTFGNCCCCCVASGFVSCSCLVRY